MKVRATSRGYADHEPVEAESVRPCAGVPVTSGCAAGSGLPFRSAMIGAPTTTSVSAVATCTVATAFETVISLEA